MSFATEWTRGRAEEYINVAYKKTIIQRRGGIRRHAVVYADRPRSEPDVDLK